MGKYHISIDGAEVNNSKGLNDNVQLVYILNKIANELAEANRLKAVELELLHKRSSIGASVGDIQEFLEKLVDQA